jgi:type I restriction enzyme, S subunit
VGIWKISQSDLEKIPIPTPPIEEQQEIRRRVEALFAKADRIEAQYKNARHEVDRLTPALLAKAFRGELVPPDPNDEPARVLLERVKEGRSTPTQPTKAKRKKKP